ncbi:calreticulin [Pseudoscourfieldia marina]
MPVMSKLVGAAALLAFTATNAHATTYFKDDFAKGMTKWKASTWKENDGTKGEFTVTAGDFFGDEKINTGIKTGPDARFFATYADFDKPFTNEGKDLVFQFSAKNEQGIDCGGGYFKLLPKSSEMKDFSGDTPYSIMFGPDICGATKRVHAIFTYKGKNLLKKVDVPCETDKHTHVYTLHVKPDNTYDILVDGESKASGNLEDDWEFLKPKTIKDPDATKPDDWDERAQIPDESDVKPEGWDDIPAEIPDPEAEQPEDWDEEDDGTWEAPMIPNPEYKGEWKQKMIDNPDYKGVWVAPDIDNPEYEADDKLYLYKDLAYVATEIWQVKAGTVFDNIIVTDDIKEADKFRQDTYGATIEAEKEALKEIEDKKREEDEAKAKEAEEERKKLEAEEEDEEEEDEEDEEDDTKEVKDEL